MNPRMSFGEALVSIEQLVAFQEAIGKLRNLLIINQKVLVDYIASFNPALGCHLYALMVLNNKSLNALDDTNRKTDECIRTYLEDIEIEEA